MDPTTEQELQQMMSELRGAFSGMPDATKEAEKGLKAFGKATGKGAVDIGKGLGGFALQVGKGDTSFKSLNKVIDVTAGALGGMAKALPVAGDAIAAGITAAAEAAKFMLDQMDQVAQGFNEMGSVGALTADGMTGLARQFTQSGLGLQSFTKLVADNSQALARMSGIAGDGAEIFSQAIGKLTQGEDDSLRKLGMNADQIGQTVGAFVTQQTRMGRTQNMTAAQLADGAKQYALELDKLGKLTGLSRDQIQKEQDAARSDSRFRANLEEMEANGQKDRADAIMNLKIRFGRFDKELGQGIMDLTSGAVNTDAARKLVNTTGGAAQSIVARLKSGEIDEAEANQEMVASFKLNKEKLLQNALYVADSDSAYNRMAGVADAIAAGEKSNDQVAEEMQKKQLENTDDLTKSTVEAQKSMEALSRTITEEALKFLPDAAKATKAVAKQMNELAKYIRDTISKSSATPTEAPSGVSGEFGGAGGGAAPVGGGVEAPGSDAEIAAARKSVAGAGRPVAGKKVSQEDLASMGLKIKKGDVQAKDSQLSPQLLEMAQQIQTTIPGFSYFSGFNDLYHQGKDDPSKHKEGRAVDFALTSIPTVEQGQKIAGMLKNMGASYVKDEYNGSSKNKKGGHMHAEVSAASGAILSGPMGGYTPNLTMHGTEAIVPIDTPATASGSGMGDMSMMLEQLAKMEELTTIFRNQLSIDQKLLSYSS
jgi:hypothetical protein